MNGSFYVGDELTRIYKKGKGYLTLVQKVTPTSYITMHTIFENTFDFKNYPSIEEMLSDTVSLAFRFQNTKNVYPDVIKKELPRFKEEFKNEIADGLDRGLAHA